MRRDLGSTIALPIISYRKWKSLIPSVALISALTFSKFMTSTTDSIKAFLSSDLEYLQFRLLEVEQSGESSYETSFLEICIESIKNDIEELSEVKGKKVMEKAVVIPTTKEEDSYYFYQASDGQHLYLHPLDIKVLKQEFGVYADFPGHLKLPLISIRESTVNAVGESSQQLISRICENDVTIYLIYHFPVMFLSVRRICRI